MDYDVLKWWITLYFLMVMPRVQSFLKEVWDIETHYPSICLLFMLKVFLRLFEKLKRLVKLMVSKFVTMNMSPLVCCYCFLFFRASVDQANKMRVILSTYERVSGQTVNLQKSEIFCIRNVLTTYHKNIASIMDA